MRGGGGRSELPALLEGIQLLKIAKSHSKLNKGKQAKGSFQPLRSGGEEEPGCITAAGAGGGGAGSDRSVQRAAAGGRAAAAPPPPPCPGAAGGSPRGQMEAAPGDDGDTLPSSPARDAQRMLLAGAVRGGAGTPWCPRPGLAAG